MSAEEEIIEVTIDMAELKKMKVPELKKKVAELGLPTKGTKAELLARVEKYLHEQEEEEELFEEEEEEEEAEGEGEEGVEGEEGGEGEEEGLEEEGLETVDETKETVPENKTNDTEKPALEQPPSEASQTVEPEVKKGTVTLNKSTSACQAERLAQRAAKFGGNTSEEAKKIARAERFGTTLENGAGYKGLGKRATPTAEEMEKLKKRAERFGSSVSPAITMMEDDEKKKKRMERFGLSATELAAEERKKMRAARFGKS